MCWCVALREYLKVGAEFCGWKTIRDIYEAAKGNRNKLLILSLMKTGGRISEVLDLTKSSIDYKTSERCIIVRNMRVGKKWYREKGKSITMNVTRSIPVLRSEELSDEWLDLVKRSRYQVMCYGRSVTKPMTRITAYGIVTATGRRVGVRVTDHWFRGMRASQLAEQYGFGVYDLNQYFGWGPRNPRSMAEHYASLGWRGLEQRMLRSGAL